LVGGMPEMNKRMNSASARNKYGCVEMAETVWLSP